jgi:hypothetical protein
MCGCSTKSRKRVINSRKQASTNPSSFASRFGSTACVSRSSLALPLCPNQRTLSQAGRHDRVVPKAAVSRCSNMPVCRSEAFGSRIWWLHVAEAILIGASSRSRCCVMARKLSPPPAPAGSQDCPRSERGSAARCPSALPSFRLEILGSQLLSPVVATAPPFLIGALLLLDLETPAQFEGIRRRTD